MLGPLRHVGLFGCHQGRRRVALLIYFGLFEGNLIGQGSVREGPGHLHTTSGLFDLAHCHETLRNSAPSCHRRFCERLWAVPHTLPRSLGAYSLGKHEGVLAGRCLSARSGYRVWFTTYPTAADGFCDRCRWCRRCRDSPSQPPTPPDVYSA